MVEANESTRQRVESSLLAKHEDRIVGKSFFTSMTHYNLVLRFIPITQAMKILDAKEKELKNSLEDFLALIGLSMDLVQKRSGTPLTVANQTDVGIGLRRK